MVNSQFARHYGYLSDDLLPGDRVQFWHTGMKILITGFIDGETKYKHFYPIRSDHWGGFLVYKDRVLIEEK